MGNHLQQLIGVFKNSTTGFNFIISDQTYYTFQGQITNQAIRYRISEGKIVQPYYLLTNLQLHFTSELNADGSYVKGIAFFPNSGTRSIRVQFSIFKPNGTSDSFQLNFHRLGV